MKTVVLLLTLIGDQDVPQTIAKKDLPKAADCTACTMSGEDHGKEKPAGGFLFKGKSYYFCNAKELDAFRKDPEAFIPLPVPRPMPDLGITDTAGKIWNAEALKGKVVMIDFWATWCGPCKAMFPTLDKLVAKYKDSPFVLLSVSVDQKKGDLDKYLKGHKFPNPVLHDTVGVFAKWGVRNIPATFLIKDGQVIGQWTGKQAENTLDKAIAAALATAALKSG